MGRWGGLPIFIRHAHRRAGQLLDHVGLSRSYTGRNDSQSSWTIEARNLSTRQSFTRQQGAHALAQLLGGRVNHSRRNFFASDL
jgi:hypothetical protein